MRKLSHFKIGLFIVACTAIALGALVWIGAAHLFQHRRTYATYFSESVGGLDAGSNVNYLGVPVGKVTKIAIAPDRALIQVLVEIKPDFRVDAGTAVQLQFQGITGQRNLAIVKAPPDIAKVTPAITFPVKYPVIPSCPGELTRAEKTLKELAERLSKIDLEGLVSDLRKTAHGASNIVTGRDLKETLSSVREVAYNMKVLSEALGSPEKRREWRQAVADLAASAAAARQATQSVSAQLGSLPPDALGKITRRIDEAVGTGERAVVTWDRQVGSSLVLLQQDLIQLNQIMADLERLIHSLQNEPGRIFTRPETRDPFGR